MDTVPGQPAETIRAAIINLAFLGIIVAATWFWWPQITSLLSGRPAGAPVSGQDCRELDWDEWARPLYDCRPITPDDPPAPDVPDEPPPPEPEPWDYAPVVPEPSPGEW